MSTTNITVTKKAPALVGPTEPTPSSHLPLSYIDLIPALRYMYPMIHVFRSGHEPAKVIREALAKALVPYYPVAGRIQETADGCQLQVKCTGEGVWFVEAAACCSLLDVKYLEELPLEIPKEELLPSPPHGTDQSALTFMLQVTQFKCGGFTIGVIFNHAFFDGIGVAQFMTAISETARGIKQPSVTPIWSREAIPSPSHLPQGVHGTQTVSSPTPFILNFCSIDFSLYSIGSIKIQFAKERGEICSVFDVVTAILWQCRTRAIGLPPKDGVTLYFPANIRKVLQKELPAKGGYYGNCLYFHKVRATSAEIADADLLDVIRIIKDSKEDLSTKALRWLKGEQALHALNYELMTSTDWRQLGFTETDYGWGTPSHVLPLVDPGFAGGIVLNSPAPRKGVRLLAYCVEQQHVDAFRDEIGKYACQYCTFGP